MSTRYSTAPGRCSTPASFSWPGRRKCDRRLMHKVTQLVKRDKSVHSETSQSTEQEDRQKKSSEAKTHGCTGHK